MNRRLIIFGVVTIWAILVAFAAPSIYWRDAPEFVLSGFFLDIAHPAGYPLFSQLSNLLALMPFGPIAFRINCFAAVAALLNVIILAALTYRVLTLDLKLKPREASILSLLPPLLVFSAPTFVKQALTVEVYGLNSALTLAVLWLGHVFLKTRDLRYAYLGAFVTGLGLGNHVSLAAALIIPGMVLIFSGAEIRRRMPTLILLFLIGLSVYGYLPARAGAGLPLNSGEPNNIVRLFAHMTDSRDRELRSEVKPFALSANSKLSTPVSQSVMVKDLRKLASELTGVILFICILGLLLLFKFNGAFAFALVGAGLGNYLFFAAWSAEPWLPLISICALGAAVIVGEVLHRFVRYSEHWFVRLTPAVLCLVVLTSLLPDARILASKLRRYDLPQEYLTARLNAAPPKSLWLIDHNWFNYRYLQAVESVRPDLTLVYQPRILFPNNFEPFSLKLPSGSIFGSADLIKTEVKSGGSGELSRSQHFIDQLAPHTTIVIDPNRLASEFLGPVTQADNSGITFLKYREAGKIEANFTAVRAHDLKELALRGSSDLPVIRSDLTSFVDLELTEAVRLLTATGKAEVAAELTQSVCLPVRNRFCSAVPLNNLAVFHMRRGEYDRAGRLLRDSLKYNLGNSRVVEDNLRICEEALHKHSKSRSAKL